MITKKLLRPIEKKGVIRVEAPILGHEALANRDLPNQHPQEAITGLTSDLNAIKSDITDNKSTIDTLIAEKADKTYVDAEIDKQNPLIEANTTKIEANTTSIDTLSSQVDLKANKDYVDTKDEEVKAIVDTLETSKQNTLTAGNNITIENNVISASGGDIFVAEYDVTWDSKTTDTSAGTNLKTLISESLWNDLCNGRVYFKCKTFAGSTDTGYNANIEVSLSGTTYNWDITGGWNAPFIRQQGTKIACEGTILINKNDGVVKFYAWFSGSLNANFDITKIIFYRYAE